ncbi:hypothetical protein HY468_05570 [Candidatus Roizmanbacteria bacterium]|nr:hypothetical protein [Candidatus Roizmanbacteria bacterium]
MNIKKILVGAAASAVMLGMAIPAFAAAEHLNWGSQINAGQCDKVGKPVVNIVQKVVNDVDSGQAGNYWAFDNLTRKIQVWETNTAGEYCAEVSYQGEFDGQAGQTSPGNTGTLDGSEDGTFQGGYNATITGSLLSAPLWQTRGSVGTTDYDCDIDGNCPGYVSWVGQYFTPGYGFAYNWWGWIYHNGNNVWVNSVDGNSGDVL